MATKLEQYQEIQAMVQKEARDIAIQVYKELGSQFDVNEVPVHIHNGIDTPKLDAENINPFQVLSAQTNGVINAALLGTQEYSYLDQLYNQPSARSVLSFPSVIVRGTVGGADSFRGGDATQGTIIVFYTFNTFYEMWVRIDAEQDLTLTGVLLIGATSATLANPWIAPTVTQTVTFSNGNTRTVTFTNNSSSISWTGGLSSGASDTINTDCTWKGVSLPLSV